MHKKLKEATTLTKQITYTYPNKLKNQCSYSLISGDCIENLKKLDNKSVHLILTDPPYNLGQFMHNRNTNLKKMRENQFAYAGWDNLPYDEWLKDMDMFFKESSRILIKGGSLLIFMSIIKVESIIALAEKNGFYYKTTGIWHKTNPMPRNMNLHFVNSTEAWIYFTIGTNTGTFNNDGKLIHDFFETSLTTQSEKKHGKHPTQKPIKLINKLVSLLSNKNDIVVDPFMGSGTTGVSCKKLKRKFIGIDKNKEYVEIAKKRIDEII
jgi:DNA modification methylase